MKLTKKQQSVLDILESFYTENGYWPTYREISNIMGLKSSAGPYKYIKILKEKGYVEKAPYRSRSIKLKNPLKSDIKKSNEKTKALYWIIQFQENYKVLSGGFNYKDFDLYASSININVESETDKKNIEKIKQDYLNLKQ